MSFHAPSSPRSSNAEQIQQQPDPVTLAALVDLAKAQIAAKNRDARSAAEIKARRDREAEEDLFLQIKRKLDARRDFTVPVPISITKEVSGDTLVNLKAQMDLWAQIKPVYNCKICGAIFTYLSPSLTPFTDRYCEKHRCGSCGRLLTEGQQCGGCYS